MPKTGKTFDEEHEPQTDITSLLARTLAALTSDRSQTTISPVPPPEKFRLGDDFDRWEQRVRDYLEAWEPSRRRYILLSLMDDDVYDQVFRDLPPGEVTEDTYRVLRSILVPPRPMKERRDAFRYRVQRNDETARQFATALRRLAPLAYPQFDAETLDHLTLCQFVDGVRSDAALASFAEQPPRTLSEAIDRACLKETPPTERLPEPPRDAVPTSTKRTDYSPEHHRRRQRQHWNPRKQRWNGSGNTGRTLTSESEPTPIYLSPISTINSCTLPLISGTINGVHSTILIDTGSACSLVRQAPHLSQPSFPVHRRLWAANNTEVLTLGMVQIELKIGKINIEQEAVVVPQLRWDAILGADFLDRHACIIDLGKGSLRLKGEDITFRTPMQLKLPREIEVCSVVSDSRPNPDELAQLLGTTGTVPEVERDQLRNLLTTNKDAFAWSGDRTGRTNVVFHEIDTGDARPIKVPCRRVPVHYRAELERMVQELLQDQIIKPSSSPWASPVVLVRKKDGSLRLCVDYRKLNEVTKKDSFPLPRIDETLEAVAGARYFSTLDLASGYWQVEIRATDKEKTAFTVPSGLYEFQTMPFGLTNAPATFQRLMQKVLGDLVPNRCLVYLDDIIIHSRSYEEHLDSLRRVFERLKAAGLKLKPSKCCLLRPQVQFLGHVICQDGVRTEPQKTAQISAWPTPVNSEEVRSFVGLASYYRRFIRDFAKIAAPLHRLTEKKSRFIWSEECEMAFNSLKRALTEAPVLANPDVSPGAEPFILDTDASDTGIGAVLAQKQDGVERVISYGSRCLNKHEKNYCTTRKEMLALVFFLSQFRHYLLGKEFIVRTDHQALIWLQNFKDATGQVARWQERLQEYNFRCVHRPGIRHRNADALSRRPCRAHGECPSCTPAFVAAISLQAARASSWKKHQAEDAELKFLYQRLSESGQRPTREEMAGSSWETMCAWSLWKHLSVLDGVMYFQYGPTYTRRIVVPQVAVHQVLTELHRELGHVGQRKMLAAVRQRFWWPHQVRDVVNFCNSCQLCLQMKPPRTSNKAPMTPMPAGYPNERLGIDIIGPLPETNKGNRYILVMVDYFTKWCEAEPLPRTDSFTIAQTILNAWVSRWGAPLYIHTDQGSNFESLLMADLCQLLGIKKTRTTPYHPQGNGLVERTNRTLKGLLKAFVSRQNTRRWDSAIPSCLLAYRASVQTSTGQSPHFLVTGRELRLPLDLTIPHTQESSLVTTNYVARLQRTLLMSHQLAREHLRTAQRHQKEFYDKKAYGSPVQPGEQVWLKSTTRSPGMPSKLKHEWKGPFIVIEVLSPTTCRVSKIGGDPNSDSQVVHFNRLKPTSRDRRPPRSYAEGTPPVAEEIELPVEGLGTALPGEGAV